ncbi:helix-turn-helix transcriptional regulator [Frankia sp. Mgl5]|uniref:helix-turn-helix transcriptional regulator n=1 Tax=Frankia sp. Mgl5 TaxID=2933793 RepID=UPI00200D18B8|nr:helix-turn-helix transcriptional regulator [Frankia sp. Mgl5]MCK9931460.1 helix-turn-helix transcriptional regulator [Frankia sp. Mgl5]
MDNRAEVRDFLVGRRARISPEQAGLATFGETRRVPGLRRGEVAHLAGVSVEYYTRLERGNLAGVSESVLDSLARALHLDEAERAYLFDLARTATGPARPARGSQHARVRPSIRRVLDAITGAPAYVRNARMDILAANDLCFALYADILTPRTLPVNFARFLFLDPRATDFFIDWPTIADAAAAGLRGEAGRSPLDRQLSDLIGELATRSDEFRVRWARHNVRLHRTAVKRLRHPVIGDIELTGDAMELPADALTLITYTASQATAQQQLDFLASWTSDRQHPRAGGPTPVATILPASKTRPSRRTDGDGPA